MKKIISLATAVVLCLMLLLPITVSAAPASVTMSVPSTVREGDTITVVFKLNGSNLYGLSGTLKYDSRQVQLVGTKQEIASPWEVEFNGNKFVAYDNKLSRPINSATAVLSARFKIKATAGTKFTITFTDLAASDGQNEQNLVDLVYSATVAPAASANNNLASLTANGVELSPVFNAGTVKYTASVPFEVSKLDVTAVAADAKASVAVSSPNLTPGATTNVKVTVTAENGSQKVYTIAVTRAQDPNYQASGNNTLSGITVEGFLLSPGFSGAVTEYVVWVPYETESVTVSGQAADAKATVAVVGGEALVAGEDNAVSVICTAEDGTAKTYTVIVKRAAAHGETEEPTPPVEEPSEEKEPAEAPTKAEPSEKVGFPLWLVIVAAAGGLVIGFVIGFVVKKSKKA